MAKFEVCCHKFVDLSEHNYGVSILNDSKYGFATVGNVMRLSLLRSPKAPDGNADMGKHVMRWAIMPHRGALGAATVRAAANLNNPMKIVRHRDASSGGKAAPIRLVGDDNLVLDWIKRAEDDADVCHDASETLKARDASAGKSIVVRVYDALGGFGRGVIQSDFPLEKVYKTNVLEDDLVEVAVQIGEDGGKESSFEIELGSFEVATYRLVLKQ